MTKNGFPVKLLIFKNQQNFGPDVEFNKSKNGFPVKYLNSKSKFLFKRLCLKTHTLFFLASVFILNDKGSVGCGNTNMFNF